MSRARRVEVRDLRIELTGRDVDVVDEISLEIRPGEVLGLVGESGSGKTTVGMALLGHVRRGGARRRRRGPDRRRATSPSSTSAGLRAAARRHGRLHPAGPGHVAQPGAAAAPRSCARCSTRTPARQRRASATRACARRSRRSRCRPTTRSSRRYPHQLSGGQQQRVAIAMAFACRPQRDRLRRADDRASTSRRRRACSRPCASCAAATRSRRSTSATTSRWWPSSPTASRSCTPGGSSRSARATSCSRAPRHPYTRRLLRAVPDLEGKRAVVGIPGHAPLPGNRPDGLLLRTRAARWPRDECRREFPPAFEVGAGAPGALLPRRRGGARDRRSRAAPTRSHVGARRRRSCSRSAALDAPPRRAPRRCSTIELEVHRHECLALVGESGSGKTTLARCVAGLHKDFTGEVLLRGDGAAAGRAQPLRRRAQADPVRLPEPVRVAEPAPHGRPDDRAASSSCSSRRRQGHRPARGRVPRARRALGVGRQPLPGRAVGRRAPARRDRPRARGGAGRAGVRRDHLGARRVGAGGDHRPAARAAHGDGPEPAVHHPQPRADPHDRRPRRGDDARAGSSSSGRPATVLERPSAPYTQQLLANTPEHRAPSTGPRRRRLTGRACRAPNVLLLMVDQLAAVVAAGVRPSRRAGAEPRRRSRATASCSSSAYCASPLCAPSRAALLTGPAALAHRRLRQRGRAARVRADRRPPPARRRLRRPAWPARCTSSAPTSCTASRSG